jgi:RNA recognition motif-containing protein
MKLRGLPFSISVEQLCEFFSDYRVSKSDIVIEEINGKKTGFGLVFFPDQTTA